MIYRKDLDRPLTSAEVDANFAELEAKISVGADYLNNEKLKLAIEDSDFLREKIAELTRMLNEALNRITALEEKVNKWK